MERQHEGELRTDDGAAPDCVSLGADHADRTAKRLGMLLDVPLDVTVELGRSRLTIQRILSLAPGAVVELDKVAGEPLDVFFNGRLVAHGEAVVVGDRFGVRITDIVSPTERLARMR